MFTITVNGKPTQTEQNMPLIDYLRDTLRLTSVKNGCGEGACGACTVLVDGKKQRACMYTTAKADGKAILTVEGLTDRERDVYVYCFGEAGAVQCGFCIPGMVISAKALLDVNLRPTRAEVKQAIIVLVKEGKSNTEISKELSVNYNYVFKVRKEFGAAKA